MCWLVSLSTCSSEPAAQPSCLLLFPQVGRKHTRAGERVQEHLQGSSWKKDNGEVKRIIVEMAGWLCGTLQEDESAGGQHSGRSGHESLEETRIALLGSSK